MTGYEFYKKTYLGGSIPEVEFPRLAERAGEQLAQYKRIYTVTPPNGSANAEDMAICAMADALYYFESAQNGTITGPITSSSIGSVSVSYGSTTTVGVDLSTKGQAAELYRCACLYLNIYRGIRQC